MLAEAGVGEIRVRAESQQQHTSSKPTLGSFRLAVLVNVLSLGAHFRVAHKAGYTAVGCTGAGWNASRSLHIGRERRGDAMTVSAFLTDATLCIGCKACEVACKEWNRVPADGFHFTGNSYDNTDSLGASTWRHVMFLEQPTKLGPQVAGTRTRFVGCFSPMSASTVERRLLGVMSHGSNHPHRDRIRVRATGRL